MPNEGRDSVHFKLRPLLRRDYPSMSGDCGGKRRNGCVAGVTIGISGAPGLVAFGGARVETGLGARLFTRIQPFEKGAV